MNEWTRDDLPDAGDLARRFEGDMMFYPPIQNVLNIVVSHLNAHHPKPRPVTTADLTGCDRMLEPFRAANEGMLRAERERDDALDRLDRVRDERDEATTLAVQVARERDEAVSREFNLRNAIRNHPAMRGVVGMYGADREFRCAVVSRIDSLSEAAEARTTVTRADVEKAIRDVWARFVTPNTGATVDDVIDAVCSLFGVADQPDPIEAKARELWEVAQGDVPVFVWEELDDPYREQYRRMAAHVLGSDR